MSYINIISSSSHLLNPFHGPVNGARVRASLNSHNKIVVLVAGVVIPILGAVIAFYLLTAQLKLDAYRKKFKVISTDVIKNGAGEFIVYKSTGENLNAEEYEKAFAILEKYSPANFYQNESYKIRDQLILQELQENVGLSCQIRFIPRTLYDVVAIQAMLKAEIAKQKKIDTCTQFLQEKGISVECDRVNLYEDCWIHILNIDITKAESEGIQKMRDIHVNCPCIKEEKSVKPLSLQSAAYKINKLFLETMHGKPHTFDALQQMTTKVIKEIKETKISEEMQCKYEKLRNIQKIQSSILDKVVENALELECSETALKHTFLFRGAYIKKDSPIFTFSNGETRILSLSYGTSLFAGTLLDAEATAMNYMHSSEAFYCLPSKDAFALYIPFDKIASAPFRVKLEHPLKQLEGRGEWFHSRSMVDKDTKSTDKIGGVSGVDAYAEGKREQLISALALSELAKAIKHYYRNHLIQLK